MPFVATSARIYYRVEGAPSQPLAVLVHALGTDHAMWQPQMPALLRYFRVLRVDLRGHGASDAPAGEYTIAALAEDVLAATQGETFSFCGVSLGGMIGQWLAAKTDRVNRLVLANTSPRMADPTIFDARRKTVLESGMGAVEQAVMQRFFTARTLVSVNPLVESIRNTLLTTSAQGYAGCCSAIRDMDNRPLLANIRVPSLIISGTKDVSTPWEGHGQLLAQTIPTARAAQLDTAHLSNVERPAAFTRAILGFLLQTGGPAADPLESGYALRRNVLGGEHVDRAIANATAFTRDFQELITRYAWGSVWARPGMDPGTRRLLVLAMTAALGRWEEFRLHVRTGLASGLELEDLEEVLLQVAIYAGVPAANTAFQIASEEAKA